MKRLILIAIAGVAGAVVACSPGTDGGTDTGTFPVESLPVPSDMPSVEVPSVEIPSVEIPTASP